MTAPPNPGRGAPGSAEAVDREPLPTRPQRREDPAEALVERLGQGPARRYVRAWHRAVDAYEADRWLDSRQELNVVRQVGADLADVRALRGLILYRQGRWPEAAKELEEFRRVTGSTDHHPVLADCYRAMQRWDDVDELWRELCEASPEAALVTEGRIVAAGALADQGRVDDAIRLLSAGWRLPKRAKDHHLRRAYALADLYERAGDHARARQLFGWVAARDPDFVDVADRVASLG